MQSVIIALLILINLILWLVFFIKFKRLFSTDEIIQKTRNEYDLLLSDVNRNTLQNINLIDMKIEELKSLIEVADRRLSTVQSEVQFHQAKSELARPYSKRSTRTTPELNAAAEVVEQESAYNIDFNVKKSRKKLQSEPVSVTPVRQSKTKNVTKTQSEVKPHSSSKAAVQANEPVDISGYKLPNIYMSDNPIKSKQTFQEQVRKLYDAGYTVDQIAHELNKSTTEVELIVEML